MADRRTSDDGATHTTVIEKRSSGAGIMIGLVVVIALIAVIAYFLFVADARDQQESQAVAGAAEQVGEAAQDTGRSISDAADRAVPEP